MFKISFKKKEIVIPGIPLLSCNEVDYLGYQAFVYDKNPNKGFKVLHYVYSPVDGWVYHNSYTWVEYERVKQLLTT